MVIRTAEETLPAPKITPPRCRVAHAWLADDEYALLEQHAKRHRTHADVVAGKLLRALLAEEEIAAQVLDR